MRKTSKKQRNHAISVQRAMRRKQQYCTIRRKRRKCLRVFFAKINLPRKIRAEIKRKVYQKRHYNFPPKTIQIEEKFGIEERAKIDYFLEKSSEFIDSHSSKLVFNLKNCTRVWPSGVVLLCSLKQWVELTTKNSTPPTLGSTASESKYVNSYLEHCGFYDYVGRPKDQNNGISYSNHQVVKVVREKEKKNISVREDEIEELLNKYSSLTKDEIEKFSCVVLIEVFNNVKEHGVANYDDGWFVLAQYHETHKIISVCIADNGIGFRHSLMTGPQREQIQKRIQDVPENDGKIIQMSFEENVSGAEFAAVKKRKKVLLKGYDRGAKRGNGLKRILKTCKELKIPFSILSHHGYVFFSDTGEIIKVGSKSKRVFAGTMYHFTIPTKQ